jgi:hypothetical protein
MQAPSGPTFHLDDECKSKGHDGFDNYEDILPGPRDTHAVIVAQFREIYGDCDRLQMKIATTSENDIMNISQIIPIYSSIVNQVGVEDIDENSVLIDCCIQRNEFEIHVDSDPFIIIRRGVGSRLSLRRRCSCNSSPKEDWEVLAIDHPNILCDRDQIRLQITTESEHHVHFEFQQLINIQ